VCHPGGVLRLAFGVGFMHYLWSIIGHRLLTAQTINLCISYIIAFDLDPLQQSVQDKIRHASIGQAYILRTLVGDGFCISHQMEENLVDTFAPESGETGVGGAHSAMGNSPVMGLRLVLLVGKR
jgi:hypothetical protein